MFHDQLQHTWIERVFDAQNAGPVSVVELFEYLFFGHIGASVFHSDPSPHVVKLFAIQLEKLDE